MIMKLLLILGTFVLIAFVTPAISATTYAYSPNLACDYASTICGDINNYAMTDGTCDDGDYECAYRLCDPYKFFPNLDNSGTDCANFLSQCLIAGTLALPGADCGAATSEYVGGGYSGVTWATSKNIDAFLLGQSSGGVVTKFQTLISTSPIPVELTAGDVMIFYNIGQTQWHSTFVSDVGTTDNLYPVLSYHGGSGSSLSGGGLVCNATSSYKYLFTANGGPYTYCDYFHFGPVNQEPPCVGCHPPSNAPTPPSTLIAQQVPNGIQLLWTSTSFGNSSGDYRIYRRLSSTPNASYSTCIASLSTTSYIPTVNGYLSYIDTLSCLRSGLPGTKYSYSIAAANLYGEGCNGPFASSCNWQTQGCGVCSIKEATAIMPSTMTIQKVNIPICPTVTTIHGNPINIGPVTNIYAGPAGVNFISP